jgi:hypothetical protein
MSRREVRRFRRIHVRVMLRHTEKASAQIIARAFNSLWKELATP